MEGLRTRALSGENAGRGMYVADHAGAAKVSPGAAGVSETGRVHWVCIAISGPGPWVVGRDRSFGDLSVCVDLAFGTVFRVCVGVPEGSSDCVCWWRFCWSRVGQGILASA